MGFWFSVRAPPPESAILLPEAASDRASGILRTRCEAARLPQRAPRGLRLRLAEDTGRLLLGLLLLGLLESRALAELWGPAEYALLLLLLLLLRRSTKERHGEG